MSAKKKPKPTKCAKCGKPIKSERGGVDHDLITAVFAKFGKVDSYHAECAPRPVPRRFGMM